MRHQKNLLRIQQLVTQKEDLLKIFDLSWIKQTLEGVKERRDEVLEKALEVAQGKIHRCSTIIELVKNCL